MGPDERWLVLVTSAVRIIGWLILAGSILYGIRLLEPFVVLVAGRSTAVDVSMRTTVSVGINLAAGILLVKLWISNRGLRVKISTFERDRQKPKGKK